MGTEDEKPLYSCSHPEKCCSVGKDGKPATDEEMEAQWQNVKKKKSLEVVVHSPAVKTEELLQKAKEAPDDGRVHVFSDMEYTE